MGAVFTEGHSFGDRMDQQKVRAVASPRARPWHSHSARKKEKAGTQGDQATGFRPSELERETGFEPATLSLGKAAPCRPSNGSDAKGAAKTGDREAEPVQRSLPFAADRTSFVTRLLPGDEADGGLLTVREVAVSTATVDKLCRRGVLKHVRVLNVLRIAAEELERLGSRGAPAEEP